MDKKTAERLAKLGFSVNEAGNVCGSLKHGLKIGEAVHKPFELREATGADLFAAEDVADAGKPLTYNMALAARQLVRVGSFEGPFTLEMLGTLKPMDIAIIGLAQREAEQLGEG